VTVIGNVARREGAPVSSGGAEMKKLGGRRESQREDVREIPTVARLLVGACSKVSTGLTRSRERQEREREKRPRTAAHERERKNAEQLLAISVVERWLKYIKACYDHQPMGKGMRRGK
jgi:hypothetical protein